MQQRLLLSELSDCDDTRLATKTKAPPVPLNLSDGQYIY